MGLTSGNVRLSIVRRRGRPAHQSLAPVGLGSAPIFFRVFTISPVATLGARTGAASSRWMQNRELASMHAKTLACLLASLTARPSLNREGARLSQCQQIPLPVPLIIQARAMPPPEARRLRAGRSLDRTGWLR